MKTLHYLAEFPDENEAKNFFAQLDYVSMKRREGRYVGFAARSDSRSKGSLKREAAIRGGRVFRLP